MKNIIKLNNRKKLKIFLLAASNVHIGIQCQLLEISESDWQVSYHQSMHYSQGIRNIIEEMDRNNNNLLSFKNFALLDNLITIFLNETATNFLSNVPKTKQSIDFIVLKKLTLWKDRVNEKQEPNYWNVQVGDAQMLSSSLKTPILTDFIRQNIINKSTGNLPLSYGDLQIAKKVGDIAVFIDIGLVSHITIIDSQKSNILIDSDIGPGTLLVDLAAKEAGCECGFDRDGNSAIKGSVNTKVLELLLSDEELKETNLFKVDVNTIKDILNHKLLCDMSTGDKLSTITAFTALKVSNFYKEKYTFEKKPETIWLSGGGTNNLALVDFLKAYFSPMPVKKIEELGVPDNNKSILSLGLTAYAFLRQKQIYVVENGENKLKGLFGKWVLPQ